jgi:elongation factor P
MAKASEIKTGNILRFNGELVLVENIIHRTPGNLRAFYQADMRNIKTNKLVEYRFRPDEEVSIARVETQNYQYLYEEGENLVVMDNNTYDQVYVPKALLGNAVRFLEEGMQVTVACENDEPILANMPGHVILEVISSEQAVKGNTATNATKSATVSTGAEIKVPLFINEGDKVKIDTTSGDYIERVKQ